LRRRAGHADIKNAMTTNTPRTLPSKIVPFNIRSIPKKPPAPSVRRRVKAKRDWSL
jgi:hypothetical protein